MNKNCIIIIIVVVVVLVILGIVYMFVGRDIIRAEAAVRALHDACQVRLGDRKYILYYSNGGLIHNLSMINLQIQLAKKYNRTLLIYSKFKNQFKNDFDDIFYIDDPELKYNTDKDLDNVDGELLINNEIPFKHYKDIEANWDIVPSTMAFRYKDKTFLGIDHDKDQSDVDIVIYKHLIGDVISKTNIKIQPNILRQIYSKTINTPYIGVHFRNTDHKNNIEDSFEQIHEQIEKHKHINTLFLATDDNSSVDEFRNEFNDKIERFIHYNNIDNYGAPIHNIDMPYNKKLQQHVDALTDMYLLYKSNVFIPSINGSWKEFIQTARKNPESYIFHPDTTDVIESYTGTIPNIIHFIYGLKPANSNNFPFIYYISILSAYIINKPQHIYLYYHYDMNGKWFDKLKDDVPILELVKIDIPTHIGNKPIKQVAHMADKIRMEKLIEHGGIYMDMDTISVRPYKHLLNNEVVLGEEKGDYGICNAIMMTIPNSEFFKLWWGKYEKAFEPDGWEEASIKLPKTLANQRPDLLTLLEPSVFFLPNWTETQKIFKKKTNMIPKKLITLHLWEQHSMKYIKNIDDWDWADKNNKTLYGRILLSLKDKL